MFRVLLIIAVWLAAATTGHSQDLSSLFFAGQGTQTYFTATTAEQQAPKADASEFLGVGEVAVITPVQVPRGHHDEPPPEPVKPSPVQVPQTVQASMACQTYTTVQYRAAPVRRGLFRGGVFRGRWFGGRRLFGARLGGC